jgi:7-cyano-7-deazaguanine synthase
MKTVVLLSGGIDSTLALAMAKAESTYVEALTIDYGQRHRREIHSAFEIAHHYDVDHKIVSVDPVLFGGSALTDDTIALPDAPAAEPDATYVPARNTVLLAMAAARAETIDARRILIGCNADDAAGYPDCRPAYIRSFRDVLQEGTLAHVWVQAPLLSLTKVEVLQQARLLDVPLHLTWSCYEGLATGPCGRCGACRLREATV